MDEEAPAIPRPRGGEHDFFRLVRNYLGGGLSCEVMDKSLDASIAVNLSDEKATSRRVPGRVGPQGPFGKRPNRRAARKIEQDHVHVGGVPPVVDVEKATAGWVEAAHGQLVANLPVVRDRGPISAIGRDPEDLHLLVAVLVRHEVNGTAVRRRDDRPDGTVRESRQRMRKASFPLGSDPLAPQIVLARDVRREQELSRPQPGDVAVAPVLRVALVGESRLLDHGRVQPA